MSEYYSNTPPTEPGWYWIRCGINESVRRFQQHEQDKTTQQWILGDFIVVSAVLVQSGYEFGPCVPSASDIVKLEQFYEDYRYSYKE